MANRRVRALVAAALLPTGGYVRAQGSPGLPVPADTQLEAIVVTAQKRTEDGQAVPVSLQAFSGRNLEDLGVKSSSDLAQFAANVEIALPSGAGNQPLISIRGIGLNDFDTNNAGPNGVYLDEVYLSSPSAQTFATFDLQDAEILKGPQGTLYGRNTNGGALSLSTVKPSDEPSAYLHGEYATYDTANLQGAVGGALGADLDGRLAFQVNHSNGYLHNLYTGGTENGVNDYAARGMLLYRPGEALSVLFNVHAGQVNNRPTEYRHLGDLDPVTRAPCSVAATYAGTCVDVFGYGTPAHFYDGEFDRQQHLRVTTAGSYLKIDYQPERFEVVSISALDYNMKLHPEDSDASPNNLLEINYGVHSTNLSQEFRVSQSRTRYHWVGGLYYLHEELAQNQPISIAVDGDAVFGVPGLFDGLALKGTDTSEQSTDAYALFGQGEWALLEPLRLILGGRVNEERKRFRYEGAFQTQRGGQGNFGPLIPLKAPIAESLDNGNVSWRMGLNYQPTTQLLAYLSVATGFKSGDFNGGFLSVDALEVARQLKPVRPETVRAYESGIKSGWLQNRLQANLAVFYNDYRDMQVFELTPSPDPGSALPINVLDNAPRSHTMGIDLHLAARLAAPLTATLEAGILQAKIDQFVSDRTVLLLNYSGNQLPFAPHGSLSLRLEYRQDLGPGSLTLQGNASFKSHVFFDVANDPYTEQAGYWIANTRAAYAYERWEAALYVHNLTDQHYYNDKLDLGALGFIEGVIGTPRMAGLEVTWRH